MRVILYHILHSCQSLLNAATTSFDNTLTVMGNYSGQFTCLVSNSIGITNSSYTVTGQNIA